MEKGEGQIKGREERRGGEREEEIIVLGTHITQKQAPAACPIPNDQYQMSMYI